MIDQVQLSPEAWERFWRYYAGQPHQREAIMLLRQHIIEADPGLLSEASEWVSVYRTAPKAPAGVSNTWEGIEQAAQHAGAKYPQCVAAQWALESGFGQHTSGKNNFFGIKGKGTSCQTWEDYGQGAVTVQAEFMDFDTIQACINYLVDRWYKDYKGYKGVNRANSADECARLLKAEGYATDPVYADKLIRLMKDHA
jgi:hypothetical protein